MGMFFHAKPGWLWLSSKSDERWNVSVEVDHVDFGSEWFKETADDLTKKFGDPPSDLNYGAMKD